MTKGIWFPSRCGQKFEIHVGGKIWRKKIFSRTRNENVIVFHMKKHCDMKIIFCINEYPPIPMIYWVQDLGGQNLKKCYLRQ